MGGFSNVGLDPGILQALQSSVPGQGSAPQPGQAPQAQAPSVPGNTPDSQVALPYFGQGTVGTQGQPASPTTPTTPSTTLPPKSNIQWGDPNHESLQELRDALDELRKPTDAQQHLRQLQAYTPQMIAEDQYNKMFGITKVPAYTKNNGTNAPDNMSEAAQIPTGQMGTKTNWGKYAFSTLQEMARAFSQKENYVPVKERLMQSATQQYNAMVNPAAREAQYDSENQRAALRSATSLLNTQARTDAMHQANAIRQFIAENNATLLPARKQLLEQRAMQLDYNMDPNSTPNLLRQSQLELNEAQTGLRGAQTGETNIKAGNEAAMGGVTGPGTEDVDLSNRQSRVQYLLSIGDKTGAAQEQARITNIKRNQAARELQGHPETFSTIDINGVPTRVSNRSNRLVPVGANTSGGGVGATIQDVPGSTKTKVPLGALQSPSVDWTTPQGKYGNIQFQQAPGGRDILPKFNDTPPGRNGTNDATLAVPVQTLKGRDETQVQSAGNLYQVGRSFLNTLNQVDPASLTQVQGNWDKFIAGTLPVSDPKLRRLQADGHALAIAHIGSQGVRSGNLAETIAKEVNSWGTGPEEIKQNTLGFVNQASNVLRQNAGSKLRMAPILGSYREMQRVYNPDDYQKETGLDPENYGGENKAKVYRKASDFK